MGGFFEKAVNIIDPGGNLFSDHFQQITGLDFDPQDPLGIFNPGGILGEDLKLAPNQSDAVAAELIRSQFEDFRTRYAPLEDRAVNRALGGDTNPQADAAGNRFKAAFDQTLGVGTRNRSRLGVTTTRAEDKGLTRRADIARATGVAGAENTSRAVSRENNIQDLSDLAGHLRGIASTARTGINSAADLGASRNLTNMQLNSAAKQQNASTATSVGMAALAFFA